MFQRHLADLSNSPRCSVPVGITPRAMKRRKKTSIDELYTPFQDQENLLPDYMTVGALDSTETNCSKKLFSTPLKGKQDGLETSEKGDSRKSASEFESQNEGQLPPSNVNPFFNHKSSTIVKSAESLKHAKNTPLAGSNLSSSSRTANQPRHTETPLRHILASKCADSLKAFTSPSNSKLRQGGVSNEIDVDPTTPHVHQKDQKSSTSEYYLSMKLKRTCSIISDSPMDLKDQEDEKPGNFQGMHLQFSSTPQPPPPPVAQKNKNTARRRTIGIEHPSEDKNNKTVGFSRFKYEFEALTVLGGGTFGTVYKCKARLDGCLYAVKTMRQKFKGKADRERVLKEVYALAALCHDDNPHIVRYFSAWIEDCRLYIQTELCDMSLEDILKEKQNMSVDDKKELENIALTMVRHILHALSRLHRQNIVHLDIKPANIFIKNGAYKLGDLGHACLARMNHLEEENKSNAGDISTPSSPETAQTGDGSSPEQNGFWSPGIGMDCLEENSEKTKGVYLDQIDEGDSRYMARELLQEDYSKLPKADIFSLGASMYEIALGRELPANGPEWNNIRNGQLKERVLSALFEPIAQLIRLMMHPEADRRPSAETLLASGGPQGILRSEFEIQLAREKAAADEYRKELARIKSQGNLLGNTTRNRMRRSNTL